MPPTLIIDQRYGSKPQNFDAVTSYPLVHQVDMNFVTTDVFEGHHSRVFRGTVTSRLGSPNDVKDCVVKIVYGAEAIERLHNEATLYSTALCELQGTSIPRFYGFFEGKVGNQPAACIMLQYAGQSMTDSDIKSCSKELRTEIVELLARIHRDYHVLHGDFRPPNILLNENRHPVLIDFGNAQSGHKCGWNARITCKNEPKHSDGNCKEIRYAGMSMRLWFPRAILYLGSYYPISEFKNAEELAAKASPNECDRPFALRRAQEAIESYRNQYIDLLSEDSEQEFIPQIP